jgi:hypothetical protein
VSALTVVVRHIDESTWQSIREWAIAVGTVGATLMAVYVGVLREWRRRPKLTLLYGGPTAGDAVVVKELPGLTSAAYVRLRVVAAKRRSAAEDVEVMILRARVPSPTDDVELNPEYLPFGDIALDGQLLAWSNAYGATRLTIPPGTHRHLDLVRIVKPLRGSTHQIAAAQIQVAPEPADGRHNVKAWRVDLELAVTARNMDARRYRVTVMYDGGWGDEDPWDHLTVSSPERIKK